MKHLSAGRNTQHQGLCLWARLCNYQTMVFTLHWVLFNESLHILLPWHILELIVFWGLDCSDIQIKYWNLKIHIYFYNSLVIDIECFLLLTPFYLGSVQDIFKIKWFPRKCQVNPIRLWLGSVGKVDSRSLKNQIWKNFDISNKILIILFNLKNAETNLYMLPHVGFG